MDKFFYDVCVSIPLRQAFSYHSSQKIKPGTRVVVKFGSRVKLGIIIQELKDVVIKTKQIDFVLDDQAVFSSSELSIFKWAADYYHHPIGEVVTTFLPPKLRQTKTSLTLSAFESATYTSKPFHKTLNSEQSKALEVLTKLHAFAPALLFGVTGSGKTEIYLRLIHEHLINSGSVLLLAPEISLTPQLVLRLKEQFGDLVGMYHSKMTPASRYKAWKKFNTGSLRVIVGTRSAAMLPSKKLSLIILDEEHDSSFKQHEGFRFSARDIAIKRAQKSNIPIVLGSATPSLRTLKLVEDKKFKIVKLTKRVTNQQPPKFSIVDINGAALQSGLAPRAIEAIANTLKENKQAMIFINRRGFAPRYVCADCAWMATCNACETGLVFHHHNNRLVCHRCESAYGVPMNCPSCNKTTLSFSGTGTEQLELTLNGLFPNTKIFRVDKDSTKLVGSLETLLDQIQGSEQGILIGTQMLIKGHDFPNLELVVAIDVDQGVTSLNAAATEDMGQQLIQVAGRAGRLHGKSLVLVQTRYSEDKNLQQLKNGDYLSFAASLMSSRKMLNQPPYSFEAVLRASSPKATTNLDFLNLAKTLIDFKSCILAGPMPSMQSKVRGSYQHYLLIQAPSRTTLNLVLQHLVGQVEQHKSSAKVRWTVDVDPVEF